MTKNFFMRGAGALFITLALLAGCGGGQDGGSVAAAQAQAPAPVTKVDGWVQPASTDQGVSSIKSRSVVEAPKPTQVVLGELAQEKTAALASTVGPRKVGAARDVGATRDAAQTLKQLQWKASANGGQVAAISFTAQGAHGLRLGVVVKQLPGSAQLRVYSQARAGTVFQTSGQDILQRIQRNAQAGDTTLDGQTWWTPDLGSDEATLEVELPPGTPASAVDIAVPRVSHIFENLSIPTDEELSIKINESASCQLDASCYESYASQRNAVARMLFTSGADTFACTGTLLNDNKSSGTPYFLSANHCISSQTVASTLQTDWFYRAPACNSRTLSSTTAKRVNGATLLYASNSTDTALLRLNDAPPAGAFFAGWDASTQAIGASVVGLHHPQGDLLKISFGTLNSLSNCTSTSSTQFQCSGTAGNFYRVNWSQGTTEGGSSGSALFKGGTHVIGTLYGGSASCLSTASPEFYGRFDVAYNAALKNWLAPAASAATRTAVYRFYNAKTGAHFYTASAAERDFVIRTFPEFGYENIAFYAYADASSGKDPVFRFYNDKTGAHFYSGSVAERDFVIARLPEFRYEVVSWYAQTNAGNDASAIFRFYNDKTGAHFYTISVAERDFVIQVHKDFRYEGPMYYAWTSQ
ncbi:trypsin-like peptidase domain-containing protein [Acidovorax sp. NPDC077693]|uniref:trypsin-like peptidase domain-containing protein n=1 Tax=unclassified Acidovorax TaxID=2684926 RepID=UPI0037C86B4F